MSSLRVEHVKSSGRKPTLDSSKLLVVRNTFNFSALAGLVFWICVRGLAAVAASLVLEAYATLTSLNSSGWRSSTLSNFTSAKDGLVLLFS
jgi:hypothetical protein